MNVYIVVLRDRLLFFFFFWVRFSNFCGGIRCTPWRIWKCHITHDPHCTRCYRFWVNWGWVCWPVFPSFLLFYRRRPRFRGPGIFPLFIHYWCFCCRRGGQVRKPRHWVLPSVCSYFWILWWISHAVVWFFMFAIHFLPSSHQNKL